MKKKSTMEKAAEQVSVNQDQVLREFSLNYRAGETDIEEVVEGAYQQVGENDWRLAADLFNLQNGEKRKEGFIIEQTFFDNAREGFDVFTDEILSELNEVESNFRTKGWNILSLEVQAGVGIPIGPTNRLSAEATESVRRNRWVVQMVNWELNEEREPISGKDALTISRPDLEETFEILREETEKILQKYKQRLPR